MWQRPMANTQWTSIEDNAFAAVKRLANLRYATIDDQSAITYPGFDLTARAVPRSCEHFLNAFGQIRRPQPPLTDASCSGYNTDTSPNSGLVSDVSSSTSGRFS